MRLETETKFRDSITALLLHVLQFFHLSMVISYKRELRAAIIY